MAQIIGTLGEKSLHAALKDYYAQPGDTLECALDGYVVDIARAPEGDTARACVEIQTRGFSTMKAKLAALLEAHAVKLVHPIAQRRTIVRVNGDGEIISRRKSPKRGTVYDLFAELVSLPYFVPHPNFRLEVVLIHEEQIWVDDGRGSWRRKRWSIRDRRLTEVTAIVPLHTTQHFASLLPDDLPPQFDTQELADGLDQKRFVAQKMAYCLREMGVIEAVGKRGKAIVYRRSAGR